MMKISDQYTHVTWYPDDCAPDDAILIQRTHTSIPGSYYVHRCPCPVIRTYLAVVRAVYAVRRYFKYRAPHVPGFGW